MNLLGRLNAIYSDKSEGAGANCRFVTPRDTLDLSGLAAAPENRQYGGK